MRGRCQTGVSRARHSAAMLIILLVASFCLLATGSTHAATMIAPSEAANAPGVGAQLPFAASGARYQNIYNASEFINALPQGGFITQIAFRIDESDRSSFSAVIPDIEIRMFTSPSSAQNLSQVFSENVGRDARSYFLEDRPSFRSLLQKVVRTHSTCASRSQRPFPTTHSSEVSVSICSSMGRPTVAFTLMQP